MPREKMVCQTTVLEMGWTKSMIAQLLPEPTIRPNPYGAQKSAPMRLWKEADVLACMETEEYKTLHAQAEQRRRRPSTKTEKTAEAPQKSSPRRELTATFEPEKFSKFWQTYSVSVRGDRKKAAIREWDELRPDDAMLARMYKGLELQIIYGTIAYGGMIPTADEWLEIRGWEFALEDEKEEDKK